MSNILTLKGFGLSFGNRRILHNIDLAVSNRGVTVLLVGNGQVFIAAHAGRL